MKHAFRLSLLTLFASGCLVSRPEIPLPECTVDSECSDGKVCGPAGKCVDQCKADADCVSPRTCVSGACKLPTGVCVTSADCSNGDVCGLGNTCAKACTTAAGCGTNEACIGGACTSLSAGLCALNSDCPSGESCVQGRCAAACSMNVDCTSPRTCQSGSCLLPTGKCVVSTDCTMGQVCGVGGTCTTACTTAAQCGANEACVGGACTSLASGACRFNSECPAPQACVQGRCSEACMTSRDCPFGTQCQTGFCAPQPPECLDATDCATTETCSPQGDCVTACASVSDCAASGEACSNGACVRVGVDTATVAGTVTLTGVTDASNLVVTVDGPNRASGRTAMNGSYSFQGLLPGLYRVRITAPNTIEGSAERETAARAGVTTTVPTITLTPAGAVRGNVTLAGRSSHEGIQVAVLGTGRGTVTGPNGDFTLTGVPVGTFDLLLVFSGYQSAQATGVVVPYAMTVTTPSVVLQPVPSGSTFAFSSIPPSTWRLDQPFSYQAVAGGGGVSSVTYALVDFPTGMLVNANTGQVTWALPRTGVHWVVLSATGGGATVYQLFYLTISAGTQQVVPHSVQRLEPVDGGVWAIDYDNLSFFREDAGLVTVPSPATLSGTITSREQVNGRTVTSFSFPQGTLSGLTAPFGTLSGQWQGGVVDTLSGVNVYTVASSTLLGGTSGTATMPTADTLGALSWESGSITSLNDGRSTATGFRANTGFIGTVSSTGFDDPTASWAANAFNGQCAMSSDGLYRLSITSHTATSFTLASDPSSLFTQGQRYFIGPCTGAFNTTYVFEDSARTSTPTFTSRRIDIYAAGGVQVGDYALSATTMPPTSSFTFNAPIALFNQLQAAATSGYYGITNTAGSHDLLITDTSAPWTSTTHSTRNFLFDDFAQPLDIFASTTTQLTVRQGTGTLNKDRTGRGWVLVDTGNNVQVTATLTTGGLTAGAAVGQYLWMDARGRSFLINANTATTVLLDVPYTDFPMQGLTGTLVGRAGTSTNYLPRVVLPTPGLTPGAHVGRVLVRTTGGTTPLTADETIVANSATSVTIDEQLCSSCTGGMARRMAQLSNLRWAPGDASANVDFRVALQGSPGFSPEALIGRFVVPVSNPTARGEILHNDAAALVIEAPNASFGDFQTLLSGAQLWMSDLASASTSPLRVRLRDASGGWTVDQWAGYAVVASDGAVVGTVTANSANELELSVANITAFQRLSAGANYAFARAHTQGTGCATPGVWIRTDFTLTGATLVPGAYTHVDSELVGTQYRFALYSSDMTGATAYVCASSFANMLSMMGRWAVFENNGRFDATFTDTTASMTSNQYAGQFLFFHGTNGGGFSTPIASNDATRIELQNISASTWFSSEPWRAAMPGTRYTVTDSDREVNVVATFTPAITAGSLDGHLVRLKDSSTSSSASTSLMTTVGQSTATTLTLQDVSASSTDLLRATGSSAPRNLTLSRGTVMRITDASASWVPGALVGRSARVGTPLFTITDNTANTLTMVTNDSDAYARGLSASTYLIYGCDWNWVGSARPNGNLVTFCDDGRLAEVTPTGAVTWQSPFSNALALTVTPRPYLAWGTTANDSTTTAYSSTWNQASWNFTPDALINAYMRTRDCSSLIGNFLISRNTATSITVHGAQGCAGASAGWRYALDPARLAVSNVMLTPGALRGRKVWINGNEYGVRDNTATELVLTYGDDYRTGTVLDVVQEGGTAYLFDAFTPNSSVEDVVVTGPTGLVATDRSSLFEFDGTTWTTTPPHALRTARRTGTVSLVTSVNTIVDLTGGMTPGALAGKTLFMDGMYRTISSNTANTITTSSSWTLQVPIPGTPYSVFDDQGLSGIIQRLATTDGSTLWLGTSNGGLYRRAGTAWTQFTVANTESTPGAADGLVSNDVEMMRLLPNGDLYVSDYSSGVSRLRGTSWTNYTEANSDLVSDEVYDAYLDPSGALWLATDTAVEKIVGTTWTHVGPNRGISSFAPGVWVSPSNTVYIATFNGLMGLLP